MLLKDQAIIIFTYKNADIPATQDSDGSSEFGSYYYILYALDQHGIIEREQMITAFQNVMLGKNIGEGQLVGPFDSLAQISDYALELAREFRFSKVSLISLQEYNLILENATDPEALLQGLSEKGQIVSNTETRGHRNFLRKIFDF